MAGYFTKLNGYVYEGDYTAGEALTSGLFVEITSSGVKAISAAGDAEFYVKEKTKLGSSDAIVLVMTSEGSDDMYVTELNEDVDLNTAYDTATYEIASGDYVRMHKPTLGDELIVTVTSTVAATLAVGDTALPNTDGTIKKKTA